MSMSANVAAAAAAARRKNDDEIDSLFALIEDEPVLDTVMAAAATTPKKKAKKRKVVSHDDDDEKAMRARWDTIMLEKDRARAIVDMIDRAPQATPTPTPTPLQTTTILQKRPKKMLPAAAVAVAVVPQPPSPTPVKPLLDIAKLPPQPPSQFPSPEDMRRLRDYVYMNSIGCFIAGKVGEPLPNTCVVEGEETMMQEATLFWHRFKVFRKQAKALFTAACASSHRMQTIADVMDECKMHFQQKPRPLAEGQPCMCAWTGRLIENNDDLGTVVLTPSPGCYSYTRRKGSSNPLDGVAFHLHNRFVPVLRAYHTVLFFPDYVNAEIQKSVNKLNKLLPAENKTWNEATETLWKGMFATGKVMPGTTAYGGLFTTLVKSCQSILRDNWTVLIAAAGPPLTATHWIPIENAIPEDKKAKK